MIINGVNYSFTQPVCTDDWMKDNSVIDPENEEHNTYKVPTTSDLPFQEKLAVCCKCSRFTSSGIFIRIDPSTVPYPSPEREL